MGIGFLALVFIVVGCVLIINLQGTAAMFCFAAALLFAFAGGRKKERSVMTDLSQTEIDSLACCPASTDFKPEPGNRTAYVKQRVKALGLVTTLWVVDEENDEVFFTWQRTPKGDELLQRYRDERLLLSPVRKHPS